MAETTVPTLQQSDPELYGIIQDENRRQEDTLILIASENYVSRGVLEASACTMTNKYAEGYPGRRYYNGCRQVDRAESLAIERIKKLFHADAANVQPHSGAQANMAVQLALLKHGDTMMGMNLAHGGHLTHGSPVNFSGLTYKIVSYGVTKDANLIDYDEAMRLAREHKPKLVIVGASAYPRTIDFARFREIADAAGAVLMADIAHIAGLVATGHHPTPVGIAEYVTFTTHKTLRGPRGGVILGGKDREAEMNKFIFPGIQGGPLMHTIAAKAAAFGEALTPSFKDYSQKVIENAAALAETLKARGLNLVSGGTDNHLMLVDLRNKNLTGKDVANRLDEAGITCNKNGVPFDDKSPMVTSGIRLGSPALTTRGLTADDFKRVGSLICDIIENMEDDKVLGAVRGAVKEICAAHPTDRLRLV